MIDEAARIRQQEISKELHDEYTDICIKHRRKHGLICNDIEDLICIHECEVEPTCPLRED